MKRKRFRLRTEPKKPVRKENMKYINYLCDGESLGPLNIWLEKYGATLENVIIEKEWGYYDEVDIYAYICVDELKEDFQRRVAVYQKSKDKYDKWCKINKNAIKKELELRKIEEAEKEKKAKRST